MVFRLFPTIPRSTGEEIVCYPYAFFLRIEYLLIFFASDSETEYVDSLGGDEEPEDYESAMREKAQALR